MPDILDSETGICGATALSASAENTLEDRKTFKVYNKGACQPGV